MPLYGMEVGKTHFRLAGGFLLDNQGLRRRLAEDSQPYQRWACACPARGRALGPPSAVERGPMLFPEIRFGKRHIMSRQRFWKCVLNRAQARAAEPFPVGGEERGRIPWTDGAPQG